MSPQCAARQGSPAVPGVAYLNLGLGYLETFELCRHFVREFTIREEHVEWLGKWGWRTTPVLGVRGSIIISMHPSLDSNSRFMNTVALIAVN
jgi:hypothetical protein